MANTLRRSVPWLVLAVVAVIVLVGLYRPQREESAGIGSQPASSATADSGAAGASVAATRGSGVAPGAAPVREPEIAEGRDAATDGAGASTTGDAIDAARVPIPIPLEFIEIFERNESLRKRSKRCPRRTMT